MDDKEKIQLMINFIKTVIERHETTHQNKTSERQMTVDTVINDYRNVEEGRAILLKLKRVFK